MNIVIETTIIKEKYEGEDVRFRATDLPYDFERLLYLNYIQVTIINVITE